METRDHHVPVADDKSRAAKAEAWSVGGSVGVYDHDRVFDAANGFGEVSMGAWRAQKSNGNCPPHA